MKKQALSLAGLVFLFSLGIFGLKKVNAGVPQEQGAQLSGNFIHTQFFGSSSTISATNISSMVVVLNANAGYQNCFTRFLIQISTAEAVFVYDGSTQPANAMLTVYGAGLGTAGINTLNLVEDHLGPICGTIGNSTTILISSNTAAGNNPGVPMQFTNVNYEGYTTAGPGSSRN